MHLANQSSEKLDKLSQGSCKLDKLSRVQWGNTLDKREGHRILRENPVNPEKQSKGEH